MSQFVSRLLVTVVALPLVLWLVWLGGWWLFALVLVAALIGLHELYGMARSLRPLEVRRRQCRHANIELARPDIG